MQVVIVIVLAVVLGCVVPWAFIRMLVPTLESSAKAVAVNYLGRPVFYGLGIVWLVWAGCAIVGGVAFASLAPETPLVMLTIAGPLALVAFALGAVDDAYGSSADRGFGGHLRAMFRGRLTTGGLKLVGMAAASLVVAAIMSSAAAAGQAPGTLSQPLQRLVVAFLAAASIALTSNLVNLLDLRPGRAIKGYGVLAVLGSVSTGMLLVGASAGLDIQERLLSTAALAIFMLGPAIAVWPYDVSARGMLGDAGANPMGAVAGLLIVAGLPWWGVVAYFVVVLSLNLASERVSFSAVIERNALLKRLDMLGRTGESASQAGSEQDSSDE